MNVRRLPRPSGLGGHLGLAGEHDATHLLMGVAGGLADVPLWDVVDHCLPDRRRELSSEDVGPRRASASRNRCESCVRPCVTSRGPLQRPAPQPTSLAVAARVAQLLLAEHEHVDHRDLFAVNRAHGALVESLRILLRALDTETAITSGNAEAPHFPGAHLDDPTPCDGPTVVTVLDAANAGADGCEHHAVWLLASLAGGRGYALRMPRPAPPSASSRPLPPSARSPAYDDAPRAGHPSSAVRGTGVEVKVSEHRAPHRGCDVHVIKSLETDEPDWCIAGVIVSRDLSDCLAIMRHSVKMHTADLLARLENFAEGYGDWDAERLKGEDSATPATRPPLGHPWPASGSRGGTGSPPGRVFWRPPQPHSLTDHFRMRFGVASSR